MATPPDRVRIFLLNDPRQADEPAIKAMTPGQRIAPVFEAARRMLATQSESIDERQHPRHALRVEKHKR